MSLVEGAVFNEILTVSLFQGQISIQVSNTAADGDPFLAFALSGTKNFTMGVDDGDDDKFKIGTTAIGTDTRLTIDRSGDVGIGTVNPTEKLEINGRVELNSFGGSTNDGAVWNDSTQKSLQTFVDEIEQSLSGVIFTATADATVSNTTTEGTIVGSGVGTKTLPANFFVAGKTIRVTVRGELDADEGVSVHQVTLKVKLGTTAVLETTVDSDVVLVDSYFEVSGIITCRTTGSSGTVFSQGQVLVGVAGDEEPAKDIYPMLKTGTTTINTTVTHVLDVTAKWNNASTRSSIKGTNVIVEVLN